MIFNLFHILPYQFTILYPFWWCIKVLEALLYKLKIYCYKIHWNFLKRKKTFQRFFKNFPRFSPTCLARRKEWKISKRCRNCSQGSCSYFTFPLEALRFLGSTGIYIETADSKLKYYCQIFHRGRPFGL